MLFVNQTEYGNARYRCAGLRLPAHQRALGPAGPQKVVAQVEKLAKGVLNLALARKAGLRFYGGLIPQLRSTGPGLRADRWLFEQLP